MRKDTAAYWREPPAKVSVIGSAGRMGSWFVRYFAERGLSVVLSDVRAEEARAVASAVGAELADTISDAVEGADVVLVCVPIEKTGEVILEAASHMRRDAILAEISSLKGPTVEALRTASSMGVKPLSLHPMFGPAAESMKGNTMVVVPVVNEGLEADIARRLFEEARIVVKRLEEHERAMAVVLSLTYFMNLAFAQVLSGGDLISLKGLAGTTFTVQMAIAESIIGEDSNMVMSLFRENRFTELYVDRFIAEVERIKALIKGDSKGFAELYDSLGAFFKRDPDYLRADERRYKVFKALRTM